MLVLNIRMKIKGGDFSLEFDVLILPSGQYDLFPDGGTRRQSISSSQKIIIPRAENMSRTLTLR